ncbi:hypothetical protein MNBD_PLANCTO02-2731 [hydrothermal vent metagenome]|uniref:Cytochrome c domain-containing protein n=1 Tax=hydrothermal vent metagenome TaxID=652676 RepID=A0A3B1DHZ1_9ZZZZ
MKFSRAILSTLVIFSLFVPTLSAAKEPTLLTVPGTWESQAKGKFVKYDGYAWYRCYVKVPDKWTVYKNDPKHVGSSRDLWSQSVSLMTKNISDVHEIYVNGKKIGTVGSFPPQYKSGFNEYSRAKVPAGLLKKGHYNCIAIRVYNKKGEGGFKGKAPILMGYYTECVLAGDWEFFTGDDAQLAIASLEKKPDEATFEEFTLARSQLDRPEKLNHGKRLKPADSLSKIKVDDDLTIDQILTEPTVAQPLSISFDERGRMWVVQYRQYPYPAGMKILSRDKYYRAVYDKISPPPPNQFKGHDRITIHEDTNGDGTFDKHKTFVDGLNIVGSAIKGRGGVYVLNAPYLLFYPDKNNDDIPDGDPVVLLEGMGMEDAHSICNSLRWGPDGWLYFLQGSTISSNIKAPGAKASTALYCESKATWRYHPEQKKLELFSEGGPNAFGMDFDNQGRLICGQNIGHARAHQLVQGAYFAKGAFRFGPLSNPYAFGVLKQMKHAGTPRFNHTVIRYESDLMPKRFYGKIVSLDPLQQQSYLTEMIPDGSTFRTKDVGAPHRGNADIGHRPVELAVGPDGAIYIGDFYEEFIAHGQHYQGQIDPESGRVYRLRPKGKYHFNPFDLNKKTTAELVELLSSKSKWHRQTALRMMGDRKDKTVIPLLKKLIAENKGNLALQALWALNASGGFNETIAAKTLSHPNPFVRSWTARLLGDRNHVSDAIALQLAQLAKNEQNPEVRSQLACSAKRLSGKHCLLIVKELLTHQLDVSDPHIPLLIWWAIESKAKSNRQQVVEMFADASFRKQEIVQKHLLNKIMQRYASAAGRNDLQACALLLKQSPEAATRKLLLKGFEAAFKGRSMGKIPPALAKQLTAGGGGSLVLRLRLGNPQAIKTALVTLANKSTKAQSRIALIEVFGELKEPKAVAPFLALLSKSKENSVQKATLSALQNFKEANIASAVLKSYSQLTPEAQEVAQTLLVSRKSWALQLLHEIDKGKIDPQSIPDETARKMTIHSDKAIAALVKKHWKSLQGATNKQMQARIVQLSKALVAGKSGDVYNGRKLFLNSCAKCHRLFNDGKRIGPGLTAYKRDDSLRMLLNIVSPSAEIREGYEQYLVVDLDGKIATGFLFDQDKNVVVLRGADGQNITIKRDNIDEMIRQKKSLMPEGLLSKMTDQQIRDLFSYLKIGQPLLK